MTGLASRPARIGLVGSGWRSTFFLRLSRLMPHRSQVHGVVTRTAERGTEVERTWNVPTFRSVGELLDAAAVDFVVVSVPWAAAPAITAEVVAAGVPVLTETPPAPDLPGLRSLWADVGSSGLVQVAEQYLMMPGHAARWAVARSGALGRVTQVQVSSTHQYHAMSMIRHILGAGAAPAVVTASATGAPLVDPLERSGWTDDAGVRDATTTIAHLDFGDGRSGLYDFTDNQWFNPLRTNRIVIRGSRGELVDDRVHRWIDERTVVESPLVRRQTGIDLNLEGFDLDHISFEGNVVYRNPFQGARLAEDDISIAAEVDLMTAWSRDEGPAPYPLAEGCQDHLLALAVDEAVTTGRSVTTTEEPWAGECRDHTGPTIRRSPSADAGTTPPGEEGR